VEVDVETGHVDVMEYFGVADCGTVMNPRSLGAQIIGGGTQGISSALFEKWVFDPRWGVTGSLRLHEARPLGFLDAPREAGWAAVELPDPNTPVGARGIGEPGIGGGATAVVSAINDALGGHYFNRTPLSADRILAAIEGRQTGFGPLQTHV
jgi:CO/xanthine dehydrogenase Mo-binding subunit